MVRRIEGTIVGAEVIASDGKEKPPQPSSLAPSPAEKDRPGSLRGTTYEIGRPESGSTLYVTISDVVLNAGTEHELRRPFEISINALEPEDGQWMVALSRILSALFRRGGDLSFLIDELRSVADARAPASPVGEIADVLETHFQRIGLLPDGVPGTRTQQARGSAPPHTDESTQAGLEDDEFPSTAEVCSHCGVRGVVSLEGCLTCLACGDSRCA